jgi:hypothetical protein
MSKKNKRETYTGLSQVRQVDFCWNLGIRRDMSFDTDPTLTGSVSGNSSVRIPAETIPVMIEDFHGFPQSLQEYVLRL